MNKPKAKEHYDVNELKPYLNKKYPKLKWGDFWAEVSEDISGNGCLISVCSDGLDPEYRQYYDHPQTYFDTLQVLVDEFGEDIKIHYLW